MSIYKITNISNLVGKRDNKFNSNVEIEYVDGIVKKTINIKPSETIFLTIDSLPLSIHRLRVKNLISVLEVGEHELTKSIDKSKPMNNLDEEEKKIELKKNNLNNNPVKKKPTQQ